MTIGALSEFECVNMNERTKLRLMNLSNIWTIEWIFGKGVLGRRDKVYALVYPKKQ